MATINNSVENSWLSTQFQGYYDEHYPDWTWASYVWIGFEQVDDEWLWVSGETGSLDSNPPWWMSPEFTGAQPQAYLHTDTHPSPGTWWNKPGVEVFSEKSAMGIIELNFVESEPVPEPTTMLLLGSGLIGLVGFRKRFRKK